MFDRTGMILCVLWFVLAVINFLEPLLYPIAIPDFFVNKKRFIASKILEAAIVGVRISFTDLSFGFKDIAIWRLLFVCTVLLFLRATYLPEPSKSGIGFHVIVLGLLSFWVIPIEYHYDMPIKQVSMYAFEITALIGLRICAEYNDYTIEYRFTSHWPQIPEIMSMKKPFTIW